MPILTLTFKGPAHEMPAALAALADLVPGIVLTPKTSSCVEAQVDSAHEDALQALPEWSAHAIVYADINRPKVNLEGLRRMFGKDQGKPDAKTDE